MCDAPLLTFQCVHPFLSLPSVVRRLSWGRNLLCVLLLPLLLTEVTANTVASKFCALSGVTCSSGVITGATGNLNNM